MPDPRKVMLVAGGSGSIGSAIAQAAAAAGWQVAVHGRTMASAVDAADRIRRALGADVDVAPFCADVAIAAAVERLVATAGAWQGRIDAVVDCVSTGPKRRLTGPFFETDPDGYSALMDLSVVHLQRLTHASLPWLRREGGTLIAFASDAGRFAAPLQSVIGASRAAIMGFVRNLATEVARDGVRVHCISPGFVDRTASATRLQTSSAERLAKLRRKAGLGLPTPADIAPLVVFLCGDDARRITGQVISINGGANA
jgi:NAD(P)-dependent dehydrogenase (short-subunit alcohol dehydrogenase family)